MFGFQLISGKLSIQNSTSIHDQEYLINAFESSLEMKDSKICNLTTSVSSIQISSTTFSASNITFTEINSTNHNAPIVIGSSKSVMNMSKMYLNSLNSTFMMVLSSVITLESSEIQNVTATDNLIKLNTCENVTLSNSVISNSSTSSHDIVSASGSYIHSISN
jgi:hypothetical protein